MASNISKQGIANASILSEIPENPYDKTIYTEPDGSKWIRIIHHNNPTSYKFASTDKFEDYVYYDSNRWFFASLMNSVCNNKWELMIKQKPASSDSEVKYRWIQYKNPLLAVFTDVAAASVTKNTSSGYSNNASYGGIYKFNSNSFFVCNNGTNGNWYCALGCWTAYNGGIPGYAGATITSGYMDLYLRITGTASIFPNGISAKEFIEI